MSLDAMKQALEALEECIGYKTSPFMERECEAAITALRAAIPHSEDCWRWHHECAAIRMERIFNES